jgi:predicted N-acyltransferase
MQVDGHTSSFDDYLGCFKSKRRITIKRERRLVLEEEDVRIDSVMGRDILNYDGLVERMFEIYLSTVDKMIWGRQYLTLEFLRPSRKERFCSEYLLPLRTPKI